MSNPDEPTEPLDLLACLARTRALRTQLTGTLTELQAMEEGLLNQALSAGIPEEDVYRAMGVVAEAVTGDDPSKP